jgi:hypothetical protein
MKKHISAVLLCITASACVPAGRIQWTQLWGSTPLQQAAATCRYQASAASPALCQGIYGCMAERQRTDDLFEKCMHAAGWVSYFIPESDNKCDQTKNPACNLPPSGKSVICKINGENYSTYDNWCLARGGFIVNPPTQKK